jgi:putative endonuclease
VTARRELGDFGERVARRHLEAAGMTVTGAKVRVRSGEIDLLAMDGDETVFVEVRTRRASSGHAAESLTGVKVDRMWRCAFDYCETNGIDSESARIDAVVIDLDGRGAVRSVAHLRGLEMPE